MRSITKTISGWGLYPQESCHLFRPERERELKEIVAQEPKFLVPRGLGRAYADAALNADQGVVLQDRFSHFLAFDPKTGILECEGGVSFEDILETFVPRGFFLGVSPGTKFVTVGGAIAADIHGKNHDRDGSMGNFVEHFHLMTADGGQTKCSRTENADLFWATIGGMGLTGIITRAAIRLKPIPSSRLNVYFEKTKGLDETLERFTAMEGRYPFTVCWMDMLATGSRLGRSVLMQGDFAAVSDLHGDPAPLALRLPKKINLPFTLPEATLNALSVKLFNTFIYTKYPHQKTKLLTIDQYFYPLDVMNHWNRGYGKRGFIQYQAVWPFASSKEALKKTVQEIQKAGANACLNVLKPMGPQGEGWLSFPLAGHTLAIDIPFRGDKTTRLVKRLNDLALDYGGRVYLAKDAFLSPEGFRRMYPNWEKFLKLKAKIDPKGKFSSSLSRRINLENR